MQVPPEHKVVVVEPMARPGFGRLESGLRIAEFGQTAEYQALFDAAERDLRLAPKTSIVWSLQDVPVTAWTSDEALLAEWLWRFHQLRQLRGEAEAGDVAIVPDFGPSARAMMVLLASLGIGVHLPGPKGELVVEVHRPDGIVIGMPGPAVRSAWAPFLRELYSADAAERSQETKSRELAFVQQVLREARETGAAEVLGLPPASKGATVADHAAPLSELMELIIKGAEERYPQFVRQFRRSRLGIIAQGAPDGVEGSFQSSEQHPVTVASTSDPEGRMMLLAFADPPAFARKFGQRFNAEIAGESLFDIALVNPDCQGIRVNSAKSETSLLIHRKMIQELKGASREPARAASKPWWKLW